MCNRKFLSVYEINSKAYFNDSENFFNIVISIFSQCTAKSDTTMVYDIGKIFFNKTDIATLSLIIPQALEEVTGQDASFEIA